jgi:hypothetical protein
MARIIQIDAFVSAFKVKTEPVVLTLGNAIPSGAIVPNGVAEVPEARTPISNVNERSKIPILMGLRKRHGKTGSFPSRLFEAFVAIASQRLERVTNGVESSIDQVESRRRQGLPRGELQVEKSGRASRRLAGFLSRELSPAPSTAA